MRIAIDIDSTLHHYWDRLSDAARRRFGIDLPYEEQLDWGITRLRPDQLHLCIQETHGESCDPRGRAVPARRRDRPALARRRPLHPRHEPSRPALLRRDRPLARADRAALRRAVLRARQGRPLPGARHRAARRRQPREPRASDRARPRSWPRSATRGTASCCEEEDVICGADWRELACEARPRAGPTRQRVTVVTHRQRQQPTYASPKVIRVSPIPERARKACDALLSSSPSPVVVLVLVARGQRVRV